jgi:hypothetical protein
MMVLRSTVGIYDLGDLLITKTQVFISKYQEEQGLLFYAFYNLSYTTNIVRLVLSGKDINIKITLFFKQKLVYSFILKGTRSFTA